MATPELEGYALYRHACRCGGILRNFASLNNFSRISWCRLLLKVATCSVADGCEIEEKMRLPMVSPRF